MKIQTRSRLARVSSLLGCIALACAASAHASTQKPPIAQPIDPGTPAPGGAPTFNAGAAFAAALSSNATGIYRLGSTNLGRRSATTFALIHAGQVKQVNSKQGTGWLAKQAGSTGGLPLTGAKFDQLIGIGGGTDRNINTLPPAARDQFLCVALLKTTGCPTSGGGSTPPPPPPPGIGGCPPGQEPIPGTPPNKGVPQCRLISYVPQFEMPSIGEVVEDVLNALIPAAQARDCGPIGCVAYFSFGEIGLFRFRFEYNSQAGFWGFNGFGLVAIFKMEEPDGGG